MDNSVDLSSFSESSKTWVFECAQESKILDVFITGILYKYYTD